MDSKDHFLELPQHLRHMVAEDAPRQVPAVCFEAEIERETLSFLAGAWPLVFNSKSHNYWAQIFIRPLNGESKPFIRFDSWSRCASKKEYENYPPHKLKALANDMRHGVRLVRHFNIQGIDEELELWANHWEHREGRWKPTDWMNQAVTPFTHGIFSSYRDFFDSSDEVVRDRILAELTDADRDFNLSRRWMKMEMAERAAVALHCQCGSWDKIEELFRSLLCVIAATAPAQNEFRWHLHSEVSPYISEEFYSEDEVEALEERWQPFIKIWRDKIYEQYKPKYLLNNQSKPLCVASWLGRHQPISVTTPTAHDLIEAQLWLSEWAHKNCSPDEAAKLTRFES